MGGKIYFIFVDLKDSLFYVYLIISVFRLWCLLHVHVSTKVFILELLRKFATKVFILELLRKFATKLFIYIGTSQKT
jgi:hypothetical protein